jgi:PAS domain S-box-containing protein
MPSKFLVVDDEIEMCNLVRMMLERFLPGSVVLTAHSAGEAMETARREKPDMALVDVKMPDVDGITLCKRLRADPLTTDVSVFMYTGYLNDAEHRVAAFESGAEGFIGKPFREIELIAQVKAILRARRSESRLQLQIARMPIACILWSPDLRVLTWNPAAEKMFGYSAREAMGKHPYDLIVPRTEQAQMDAVWRSLLRGDTTAHSVSSNLTKQGTAIVCEWSNTPIKESDGAVIGVLSMVQDITERKRNEVAMEAASRQWQTTFDSVNSAVILLGVDRKIIRCNKAAAALFGKSPEQVVGSSCCELMHGPGGISDDCPVGRLAVSRRRETLETAVGDRWFEFVADPILGPDGALCGAVHTITDITERKRAAQELLATREAADQANRAKSALLAGMSHELRTPLNPIIGFAEMLDTECFGPLNPKQHEYVHDILTSGRRLLSLIDSVLDVANIETSPGSLKVLPMRLGDLLDASLVVARELSANRGISLTLSLAPGLAERDVLADETKVKQIMFLLLSNAVKFTPGGGAIRVSAAFRAPAGTQGHEAATLEISVSDTGIGIEREHIEKIFEDFYQVRRRLNDKPPGVGLGLPLVRRLVHLCGGRVWAESDGTGKGSCFTFSLPQNRPGGTAGA